METITKSEHLPRRLSTGQRKQRLEVVRKLSDEAIKQVETNLRKGLWKKHLDDVRIPRHKSDRSRSRSSRSSRS